MSNDNALTPAAEIASIQTAMTTGAYWRDPQMQGRYTELLRQQEAEKPSSVITSGDNGPGLAIMDRKQVMTALHREGIPTDAFERWGGFDRYLDTMMVLGDYVLAIPEEQQADFKTRFDALPMPVQRALVAEATTKTISINAIRGGVSEDYIKAFSALPEGGDLLEQWGRDAPRRLALVHDRLIRCFDSLDDASFGAAWKWFDDLTPEAAGAVMRSLAA